MGGVLPDYIEETSTEVMKMSPLEMVCYVYLKNLPYIIFAEWDISNEQSHEDAARWLASQINAIHELLGKSD